MEEKLTATFEKNKTMEKESTNATKQEKSNKRKFKIPYAKKEKQDHSDQIPSNFSASYADLKTKMSRTKQVQVWFMLVHVYVLCAPIIWNDKSVGCQ